MSSRPMTCTPVAEWYAGRIGLDRRNHLQALIISLIISPDQCRLVVCNFFLTQYVLTLIFLPTTLPTFPMLNGR